jgi:DNA polymerase III subunit delta
MNQREALREIKNGRVRPVYLLYGEESFLMEELVLALRATVTRPETAPFNYHVLEAGADQVSEALALVQTMPFFDARRLVIVRDCPAFLPSRRKQEEEPDEQGSQSDSGGEALLAYLKQPAESACLVFTLKSADSRKKATKAAMSLGGAVECRPFGLADAVLWVQERAGLYHKQIKDEAAHLLVEKVGTDLRSLDSELNKLSLYVDPEPAITAAHVARAVPGTAETEVWRLTEAIMLRQREKAVQYLEAVLREADHPLQVLAAVSSQFRQLLQVQSMGRRGISLTEGPTLVRMHPYRYKILSRQASQYPRQALTGALERLLAADLQMKSGYDPRVVLETLVVELATGN